MRSLPRTKIEYGDYAWNWLRGCANGPEICATRENCWARTMANRFNKGDFSPRLDIDVFNLGFPHKASRILVCFTGDIFYAPDEWVRDAQERMARSPEHTFILLSKQPWEAFSIGFRWPHNCLLGVSLTGAETPQQQQTLLDSLLAIPGDHRRWLSYEPMLGPLDVDLTGIDWVVMGAQTGKRAVEPNPAWCYRVWDAWQLHPFSIWEKFSLEPFLPHWRNGWERMEQSPKGARWTPEKEELRCRP